MMSPNKILALLTLITTLTISDFPLIQNPNSKIPNSQVLAQTPDARKAEAYQLLRQGSQQLQRRQYQAALQSFQQVLSIYREIKDRFNEGRALLGLGAAYVGLGDNNKGTEYLQQGLEIAREFNNPDLEQSAQRVLLMAQRQSPREAEAYRLLRQGIQQYQGSQFQAALQSWQQALVIYREIGDRQGEGSTLVNLGTVYGTAFNSLGNYGKAIDYYQQSLAIAREIGDRSSERSALGNLGDAYRSLGNYRKAIEQYQQSLVIAREIGDRVGEGNTFGNLGVAYIFLGEYSKAIEYYQQSLAIFREIGVRNGEGNVFGNLGTAYVFLGEYSKAIEYQQQSLAIAREIGDRVGEGNTLSNLGATLYKQGNLVAAEKTLFEGIEVWESLREILGNDDSNKISFFGQQTHTYRILQEVLVAQNKTEQALEVAERGRARALVELLKRRLSANPVDILPATSLKPKIEQIKQIAKLKNATLVQYSIIYDDFKIEGKKQVLESELYIWVIKPTGEVTFRKADLKPLWQQQNTSLAELVTNSRESIGVRNRNEPATVVVELSPQAQQRQLAQQRQKLQQLHQLLIEPIANLLPTDPQARVIFIPQSALFLVPFPALVDASGQYLIEKHTLLTAPSIEVLNSTRQQRQLLKSAISHPAPSDVLIVGNPSMPKVWNPNSGKPEQLPYLEGAEKEAQAISNFFHVPALLDEQATERTIKQRILNARIVHLATHGLLDYGNPQDTGALDFPGAVALAPGDGEDGLLTSTEIQQMNLKAELVVLSACDTGQGRLTGDGVIGLSRSLISAGVPSVIVSLWSVDDAATAELMREFYTQWQHQPDKAQALRQAMLTTMKNHPDPLLWAAFTLIGEAE